MCFKVDEKFKKEKYMDTSIDIKSKHNMWKFSVIQGIEECVFNSVLEKFYHMGISGLVRENVQNSLDAKIPGGTSPVIITIRTGKIEKEFIPGLEEIKKRVSCLQGRNNYTKETIAYMQNKMSQDYINFISFEDSNTRGLKGANNGQSGSKEDTWGIYAYNKGFHSEEENEELEKSRGGSHGIGKIASNAASDLHIMYFANCDEEGNRHLGGTVELIEHKYNNTYYRSTGYFTDIKFIDDKTQKFYPFKNSFNEIFAKDTRGLKIIIPFLREQFNNEKEIIKSICDSFFIAIIQKRLEVVVNDKIINSDTLKNYLTSEEYYIQDIAEIKHDFTPLYFNTYMNKTPVSLKIRDLETEYNFKLYFNYNEAIPKGRVAIIRTIGMKIEDKKITGNVNKPFNAVLIPESITEDEFLKSLENESHTELSSEHIKDQRLQRNAKRFINNMSKEISRVIEEEIKKNNPTDGIMNTKDILYVIENQFKKDLSKSMATVKLSKGDKDKTIVKVMPDIPKKRKNQDKDKGKDAGEKKKDRGLKKVKKNRETNEENKEKETRYNAHPDIVERLVIGDKEFVRFDFSGSDEIKKVKVCDISLSVVDGMGVEYSNEFNMQDNYEYVIDKATGKRCKIKNNLITDIKIEKGIVQIELKLKPQFNKALKFVYYVEV